MYNEVLLDHNAHPYNKDAQIKATHKKQLHNASCGDNITVELQVEKGKIVDATFSGVGCAISQASADLMIDLLRGKTVAEAQALKEKFLHMIKTGETAPELDEVNALADISKMPARVKCAELAWQILD
jgi:SUF system FeS assembly protein, NifU family